MGKKAVHHSHQDFIPGGDRVGQNSPGRPSPADAATAARGDGVISGRGVISHMGNYDRRPGRSVTASADTQVRKNESMQVSRL